MEINEKLVAELINRKAHIACAESCTGGMIVAKIVDVPNASKVFDLGIVTYANDMKTKFLNVPTSIIDKYGVVSEEVAKLMAKGVAIQANANIAISTTGIAGPDGGTDKKPVGMVCFGFYINGETYTTTCRFGNIGRDLVRSKSMQYAMEHIYELISEQPLSKH